MLHSAVVMRNKGSIHGNGLFATESIRQWTLIWELDEPTFTREEIAAWPEQRRQDFDWYGFQCGVDRFSLPEGLSREVNHSCDPNMCWSGSDSLVARRDIDAGEEITYDYSTNDIDLPFEIDCHCGTACCRGTISNTDYLSRKWQEQYTTNLPPHVLAAIMTAHQDGTLRE